MQESSAQVWSVLCPQAEKMGSSKKAGVWSAGQWETGGLKRTQMPTHPPWARPWDSPGKNTGVGCHFLLQCMKVKSESKVAQPCPTLRDPMDCSLPGSSAQISAWLGTNSQPCLGWEARGGLVFGDWLMGYAAYLLRRSICRNMKVVIFWFVDAVSQAEATPSWA